MDAQRWERIQALFHQVLDVPPPERRAFLAARADSDEQIVDEVLALLAADARTSPVDRALGAVAGDVFENSTAPASVGPYRIIEKIGQGGMGEVYRARRDDLGSTAAIKILRDAWISPARRDRFAREQRTLAQLHHPNITTLYDADTLPDGTPYLIMEYVAGMPLTVHCRANRLIIPQRLRLFRDVCLAVQYAHHHAIIHRDLKPSNILVTADGVPKLLDFGISKRIESDAAADATRTALRLMTPAYAAPEQVRGDPAGTHTDVYALGVILYELLTDTLPFDFSRLTPQQADAVILEQDPIKPSVVARRSASAGAAFDGSREAAAEFGAISRAAWAELDVLCAAAMHKDARQRYHTVDALIRDLDHFLNGEPLDARAPTFVYRAGKFLRRHRASAATAAAVVLTIAALVTFYTTRLARARDAALAQVASTQRIQSFLLNLFEGGDEAFGPADTLRVISLVDRGLSEVRVLNTEPNVQASLSHTLGGIYQKLGQYERADSLLAAAFAQRQSLFGAGHPDVAQSQIALGLLRIDQARFDDAERLIRDGLQSAERLPASHPVKAHALWALGRVLQERGKYEEAITVLENAVRPIQDGPPSAEGVTALTELANTHFYAGNYEASDSLNRLVLPMVKQIYGERHPLVADIMINLGAIQFQAGRLQDAEAQYRPAVDIIQAFYGPWHPATAAGLTMLGRALVHQEQFDEARDTLLRSLAIQERVNGPSHPRVASILNELGNMALMQDDAAAAESYFQRTVAIYRSTFGETHYLLGIATANLASVYLRAQQYARAEQLFRDALRVYSASLPADHLDVGITRIKLGRALTRQQRYAEAEEHLRAGHDIVASQSDPGVSWLTAARDDLRRVYEGLNQPAKAAQWR